MRQRWKAMLGLAVLVAITAAFVMAALAGARRTNTALGRLDRANNGPDAVVFASQSGVFEPDFAKLRAQPEVADLGVWDLVDGNLDGQPGATLFASDDGRWTGTVDKPVVIEGRMF